MADVKTTFSTLSTDAPNVWIAQRVYSLAERNLVLGRFAEMYRLPQKFGKTLRVIRHKRLALPTAPLTEGTAPDAVGHTLENVDVTVEQWGIVQLLTDVAQISTAHPILEKSIEVTGLAMAEVLEREMALTLLGGTSVIFGGAAASRGALAATDKFNTTVALKATAKLRQLGARDINGTYNGVVPPAVEADLAAADTTFQSAQNFANVRALQMAEIGVWMGVRWHRGNFLPIFKGVAAPGAAAATAEVAQVVLSGTGGPFANTNVVKVRVVARDASSDYERKISQEGSVTITATDENVVVTTPTSTAYVYDVYVSDANNSTTVRIQFSRQAANTAVTLTGFQATGATPPLAPASGVEVFVAWVMGRDAFGRVELNGMSLQSFLTPPGASFSNPLAQGRKVGSKIMWKSFVIDNNYFTRIEVGSAFPAELPA